MPSGDGEQQAGKACGGRSPLANGINVLIEQALAASRYEEALGEQDVAAEAEEAVGGEIGRDKSTGYNAGRTSAGRDTDQMQGEAAVRVAKVGAKREAVAHYGGRTAVEGLEGWMWEWREWPMVPARETRPGKLEFQMYFATGSSRARLPADLRERLEAAEAAGGGDAERQPLAPFPLQPESPPAVAVEGEGEGEVDVHVEDVEEEVEYGPGDSAVALMYEDDTGPDVYVGMDTGPANAPLLPMPTAVPPPALGSREQRHCGFHAANDVHQHHLSSTGRWKATLLVGTLERYEFQHPGGVARERGLEHVPPEGHQVCSVQLGEAVGPGSPPR